MYDDGADVVYHAAGKSGLGVFDAAVEAAATASGRSVSTPTSTSPRPTSQKPHILTSMLKRIDTAVFDYDQGVDDGEPLDRLRQPTT